MDKTAVVQTRIISSMETSFGNAVSSVAKSEKVAHNRTKYIGVSLGCCSFVFKARDRKMSTLKKSMLYIGLFALLTTLLMFVAHLSVPLSVGISVISLIFICKKCHKTIERMLDQWQQAKAVTLANNLDNKNRAVGSLFCSPLAKPSTIEYLKEKFNIIRSLPSEA